MNNKILSFLILLLFIIGCSEIGCSEKTEKTEFLKIHSSFNEDRNKEKELVKRFQEYWYARVHGKYQQSYQYELPYQQYIVNFAKYRKTLGLYKNTKVSLIKIYYPQKDIAIITRKMGSKKNFWIKKDKWIYLNGKWYHKYYQAIFPPLNEKEAEFQ